MLYEMLGNFINPFEIHKIILGMIIISININNLKNLIYYHLRFNILTIIFFKSIQDIYGSLDICFNIGISVFKFIEKKNMNIFITGIAGF